MSAKPDLHIELLPKQEELGHLIEDGKASWIGFGGSRGGSKSGSARRLMIDRRCRYPGTWGIIIRRNFKELKRNHIDELFREYPTLRKHYRAGDKELTLPDTNGSKIYFGYADTLEDVKLMAMGGQFMDVFIDQAEQFTESEIREFKQMARWPDMPVNSSKMVLFFNMAGVGIQFFKRIFHDRYYHQNERPEDYKFLQAYAWDNVFWVLPALRADGLTITDYYSWTDQQRQDYCLGADAKSDYIQNLNSQDESLRKRDLFGSWDSLEGAYFGDVWDRDKAVLSKAQIEAIVKPWWNRWLSLDWGRGHHASSHWHSRGLLSPEDALKVLGWSIGKPLDITVTYREHIAKGASELDFARDLVNKTPLAEKQYLTRFVVSPDIFGQRSSQNTIAEQFDSILVPAGLPRCEWADNERKGGWSLMYNLLLETKRSGSTGEECWVISANCPEVANALPVLMRDPKDLDDIKKYPTLADDVGDDVRYGLKTGRTARVIAPVAVCYEEQVNSILDYTRRHLASLKFKSENRKPGTRPNWRN